jgi:glycosyltransferase involved in cell wall biosynthesis
MMPRLPPLPDSQPRPNNSRRHLRVLVNAVSARSGGGVTYALEQIAALARQPGLELTVVAVEPFAGVIGERAPGATVDVVRPRPPAARFLWEQTVLARRARGFDVVYGIGNFALLFARTAQVVTFQNPNHFGAHGRDVYREYSPTVHRIRMGIEARLAHLSLRRADVAVAISRYLRNSMLETVPASAPRIIPSAPPIQDLGQADDNGSGEPERAGPDRYVLAVANDYPHKDWDGLIASFLECDDLPPLVLVGAPRSSRRAEQLRKRVEAETPRVVIWGPETDRRRLDVLYRDADAYIAHSRLEAFALTPYEALARGVPLVASDIPSHREVCEDRADYYDPADPGELADAVRRAIARPRPAPWQPDRTWDDVADELAGALESAAERRPTGARR